MNIMYKILVLSTYQTNLIRLIIGIENKEKYINNLFFQKLLLHFFFCFTFFNVILLISTQPKIMKKVVFLKGYKNITHK